MKTYISPWPADMAAPSFPRRLSILGATGSIGLSALKVVSEHPDLFTIVALGAGRNVQRLAELAATWRPSHLGIADQPAADELAGLLPAGYAPEIHVGEQGSCELASLDEADVILSSIVGAAGFPPTLAAARAGKIIALANKESLVLGGHIIRRVCRRSGAVVLPVDSEHNAIFQSLAGHDAEDVRHLVLTASGGPFRTRDKAFLQQVTPDQALNHPNWSMGAKISIDSATLMNKGLEVIEACHLYGLPPQAVKVVVHPQSIVHSLVEYVDGSLIGHLGTPNMMIPIAHCLCYPKRVSLPLKTLSLAEAGSLTFEEPKQDLFPCLRLAFEAFAASKSHPIVLNAANEVAVALFLQEKIPFLRIPELIEQALEAHEAVDVEEPEHILEIDARCRRNLLERLAGGSNVRC
ncbi:MAG: 1-deoxy-D-xylulose-5-phosphate reductoisomerase [Desulfovibrionales bacterium]|nr:1-deoxy-D-xylulose-5-phosphate reductoisomerase [Desulfovibrionales bacterium]